jgi:hypothetical protein
MGFTENIIKIVIISKIIIILLLSKKCLLSLGKISNPYFLPSIIKMV